MESYVGLAGSNIDEGGNHVSHLETQLQSHPKQSVLRVRYFSFFSSIVEFLAPETLTLSALLHSPTPQKKENHITDI